MIRKTEDYVIEGLVLVTLLAVVIIVGKFGYGLNVLPMCANGAIAPYGDASKCNLSVSGPTVVNGIVSPTLATCPDPRTSYDSASGACLFSTSSGLSACINVGGTWNAATNVCSSPTPQKVIVTNNVTNTVVQCANGALVYNANQCPTGLAKYNQSSPTTTTSPTNPSNNSTFTPIFTAVIIGIAVIGAAVILRKEIQNKAK